MGSKAVDFPWDQESHSYSFFKDSRSFSAFGKDLDLFTISNSGLYDEKDETVKIKMKASLPKELEEAETSRTL